MAFPLLGMQMSILKTQETCTEETCLILLNQCFLNLLDLQTFLPLPFYGTMFYKAHFGKCWCADSPRKSWTETRGLWERCSFFFEGERVFVFSDWGAKFSGELKDVRVGDHGKQGIQMPDNQSTTLV